MYWVHKMSSVCKNQDPSFRIVLFWIADCSIWHLSSYVLGDDSFMLVAGGARFVEKMFTAQFSRECVLCDAFREFSLHLVVFIRVLDKPSGQFFGLIAMSY
jgi:hypothetical protein